MTAVLVHGVPETTAVWDTLRAHLPGETVALAMPGFGTPLPAGFEPTMNSYANWLTQELGKFDEPVHFIGHDWGAILAVKVLANRPKNIASWTIDRGSLDASFEWHDLAKVWQTPGAGEDFIDAMVGSPVEDRAALLAGAGVPESGALDMAAGIDATMGAAILTLYRSATKIGIEWGPGIDQIAGRGLLIQASQDTYSSPGAIDRMVERTGAQVATLPDCGHWWMLEDPAGAAALISDFWNS